MNEEQFEKMVAAYSRLVYTVCCKLTNDYHEAENITQETFLTAYKAGDNFIGENYKAWLVKVASNKCKDYLKSAYIKRVNPVDVEDISYLPDKDNPMAALEISEGVENIKKVCNSLDEPYKEIAKLYYLEEKPFEEISEILDRPVKTIQTQVYRARDKLRKLLKEEKNYV